MCPILFHIAAGCSRRGSCGVACVDAPEYVFTITEIRNWHGEAINYPPQGCLYALHRRLLYISLAVNEDSLNIAILRQPKPSILDAQPARLVASKGRMRVQRQMLVDPHAAGLDLSCNLTCALNVLPPDRSAQAHSSVISPRDDIRFVPPNKKGNDGTCGSVSL